MTIGARQAMRDTTVTALRKERRSPRPDLNVIYDRWEQFEAAGLEVQGSANVTRDAEGNVKIVFTVAERVRASDI